MLRRDVSRAGEAGRDGGLQDDGGDQEPNVGVSSSSGAHTHTHSLSLSLGHAHRHTLISLCLSSVTLRAKRWEVPTTNTISFFLGIGGKRSSFALSLSSLSPHRNDEVPQSVDADRHDTVTLTGAACVCRVCCVCVCVGGAPPRAPPPALCEGNNRGSLVFFFALHMCKRATRERETDESQTTFFSDESEKWQAKDVEHSSSSTFFHSYHRTREDHHHRELLPKITWASSLGLRRRPRSRRCSWRCWLLFLACGGRTRA